jgi:hypothetical protein
MNWNEVRENAVQGQHAFDEVIIMHKVLLHESNNGAVFLITFVAQSCIRLFRQDREQLRDRNVI